MDQRWRDGSIKEATFTNAAATTSTRRPRAAPLGKWFVDEQGFARFSATRARRCTTSTTRSACVDATCPTDLGGGLLTNQLVTRGSPRRPSTGASRTTPPATPGQIVGITYFATTRNEFDARFQAHENYEPGIPEVTVRLEGLGPDDGTPNTAEDADPQRVRHRPVAAARPVVATRSPDVRRPRSATSGPTSAAR